MIQLSLLFFFIIGTAVGSFLNVVAHRSVHGGSVFFDNSRCPHCRHNLAAKDLIPLVSFLTLRGKCAYCRKKISPQYPFVEIATGVLFALTFLYWSNTVLGLMELIYLLFFVSVLIVLFTTDVVDGLLPNSVVLPAIAAVTIYKMILVAAGTMSFSVFTTDLLIAFVVAGVFFAIVAVSAERAMGGGDVKLAFLIGLAVGWPAVLVAVFTSFLTGAIVAVMLILIGKKRFGQSVPFGPFLSFGALIAVFWGREIIDLYLRAITA